MEDNNFKRINKYLDGKMSPEEIKLFEADLRNDPDFANDLKLHKDVNGFIGNYKKNDDFRKVLDEVHRKYIAEFDEQEENIQQNIAPEKKTKIPRIIYWAVAASVLAILVFTVVLKLAGKKKTNEVLFAEYYQAQESLNLRSADTVQFDPLKNCMREFNKKNYSEALLCFKNLQNTEPDKNSGIFFTAAVYMEMHDYKNAVLNFNKLIEAKDRDFYESSIWYSGLGYLKLNKTDSALICFRRLIAAENLYKEQAEGIVKELE